MLITKTNPKGIDISIQALQTMIHNSLLEDWDIDSADYRSYGRCYRNKKDNKFIAENYEGGKEYKEVYWDDNYKAISFFGTSSLEKHDVGEVINVHLVFFCNIEKLKPSIAHRADAEVRKDVQLLVENGAFSFKYVSTELWVENCLKEYNGSAETLKTKADMHPVHCFRLNFELHYNKNIC